MTDAVKQVIATDKDGAKLSPEQLADAGVQPGEQAVIEIRPYRRRTGSPKPKASVLSTEEFIGHLRRAPGAE